MRCFSMIATTILMAWLAGCSMAPRTALTSHYKTLYSPAMSKNMEYSVYTPPGWTEQEQLPLLVLLHGASDDHRTFDHHQVGEFLDTQILAGELSRVVIVNPNGDLGFWENWYDGTRNYRDWVVKDLMPVVASNYNTLPCPQHCFVTGMSMGAHGAIRFAYYEPETFSSVAAISGRIISRDEARNSSSIKMAIMKLMLPINRIWGDINGSHLPKDLDPYINWVEKPEMADIRLMLSWGDQEDSDVIASNQRFHAHLLKYHRTHKAQAYHGEHLWRDWKPVIAESIRFHLQTESESARLAHND